MVSKHNCEPALTAAAAEEAVGNRRPAAGLLGAGAARVGELSASPTEPERRRRGGGSCEEHAPTERLADDKGERKGHEPALPAGGAGGRKPVRDATRHSPGELRRWGSRTPRAS